MNIPLVDLKKQYETIKDDIDRVIAGVISNSAFIGGSYVQKFEKEFAAFCKAKHCIGVGNGTDALFIALKALGIGQGDEVITAANSFIATSEAISMTGAKVVFVDINPQSFNLDATKIEEKITARTKAIIAVHLYGQPADMGSIHQLASQYGLKIIEDAAQAHGALYNGRVVGSIGDIGCFSFYPGKNLGAYGDAGAVVTNDAELALKVRMFANHGRIEKYNHETEGVNSRLDGLQAGVLSVKLKHLPAWNAQRRNNAHLYQQYLAKSDIATPTDLDEVTSVYHLYVIRADKDRRQKLREHLFSCGISTGIHYPIPLPNLKAYAHLNCSSKEFPEALNASTEIISLPMYPELSEKEIQYIANKINSFL